MDNCKNRGYLMPKMAARRRVWVEFSGFVIVLGGLSIARSYERASISSCAVARARSAIEGIPKQDKD